jgi:hypothetical protein
MTTRTSSSYAQPPRANHVATNYVWGSFNFAAATNSASDDVWLARLPPKGIAVGGAFQAGAPSGTSGTAIVKLGTREDDDYFGTYSISAATLPQRLALVGPVTWSTSDDALPYEQVLIATVNTATTATVSLSLAFRLDYVMPGNL